MPKNEENESADHTAHERWRELATETVRNLSRIVEDAQAMLQRAEEQLQILEDLDD